MEIHCSGCNHTIRVGKIKKYHRATCENGHDSFFHTTSKCMLVYIVGRCYRDIIEYGMSLGRLTLDEIQTIRWDIKSPNTISIPCQECDSPLTKFVAMRPTHKVTNRHANRHEYENYIPSDRNLLPTYIKHLFNFAIHNMFRGKHGYLGSRKDPWHAEEPVKELLDHIKGAVGY